MAHSLDPKYYSKEWLQSKERIVPRVAPNKDYEISSNGPSVSKMFPNSNDLKKVIVEY